MKRELKGISWMVRVLPAPVEEPFPMKRELKDGAQTAGVVDAGGLKSPSL